MSYDILFHPQAEKEYLEAFDWYEKQQNGLGVRLEYFIDKQLNKIKLYPEFYPLKHLVLRECKTEVFPYLIVYKFYEERSLVYITAIFHTSRNPVRKYRR
jgi:mRNA-degrading endonuclease RelE of RelBE toxin-antitoxin system